MPISNVKTDESQQIAQYWNDIANDFDAIYSGNKNPVARNLDRWLRRDIYQRFDWVMREAGDARGMNICDVGCGSGRFVVSLAKRGAQVTGVDFAPEMLRLGAQLAEKEGVADRCKYKLSDILDWKTNNDDKFDLVIAIGFWDYVADPLPRLQVIRSLTKTTFLSAWPRAATLRAWIRTVRLKVAGCPVYFYTLPQVEDCLQRAGFRVESHEILGQLHCVRSVAV